MAVQEPNVMSLEIESMLKKGIIQKVFSKTGAAIEQFVPCKQERWGQQTSNRSEEFEVHTLQAFQNGGQSFSQRLVERERLHLQD